MEIPSYFTPEGERRIMKERDLLAQSYPQFMLDIEPDGLLHARGSLGPTETLRGVYHLLIAIPPTFGRGGSPRVYLLHPELRPGAPHVFQDGSLCLDHNQAFTSRSTLLTLLGWVSVWLVLYEGWMETGVAW